MNEPKRLSFTSPRPTFDKNMILNTKQNNMIVSSSDARANSPALFGPASVIDLLAKVGRGGDFNTHYVR